MTLEYLIDEYHHFRSKNRGYLPQVIIMHANDCSKLEMMDNVYFRYNQKLEGSGHFVFKGIPVYRSIDIPEGEIKIY